MPVDNILDEEERTQLLALRGARVILEENRSFFAARVLDVGLPHAGAGGEALTVVSLEGSKHNCSQTIRDALLQEGGPDTWTVRTNPQKYLRFTLESLALPGFAPAPARRFTVSCVEDGLSRNEGNLAGYMGMWVITTDPAQVEAIIRIAARTLNFDQFLSYVRAIQRGQPLSRWTRLFPPY